MRLLCGPLAVVIRPASSPVRRLPSRPKTFVLRAGRPAAATAFETEVVDFFVGAAELLGVPKSLAAIYGLVFSSPTPLSFAEICARLHLSKGSVSQGLRLLREVGAIQEVSSAEDTAERFVPDMELRRLVGSYLSGRLDPQLKTGRRQIELLQSRLASLPETEQKPLRPRLQKLERWHARTRALLPLARTFLRLQD